LIEKHGDVLELNHLREVTHTGTGIVAEDSRREALLGCEPRHFRERPELTEVFQYNIGGHDHEAVTLVKEALRRG
jgi:hypothetical protein